MPFKTCFATISATRSKYRAYILELEHNLLFFVTMVCRLAEMGRRLETGGTMVWGFQLVVAQIYGLVLLNSINDCFVHFAHVIG